MDCENCDNCEIANCDCEEIAISQITQFGFERGFAISQITQLAFLEGRNCENCDNDEIDKILYLKVILVLDLLNFFCKFSSIFIYTKLFYKKKI